MLKIAICDDEQNYVDKIQNYASDILNKINIHFEIHAFTTSHALIDACVINNYDIFILDIDIPKLHAVEIAKFLKHTHKHVKIIFITNHEHHDYNTIKYTPFRFIHKSKIETELNDALNTLVKKHISKIKKIQFLTKHDDITLELSEIIYFEALGHGVTCYTQSGNYDLKESLTNIEEKLSKKNFLRVHKSFLVNSAFVFSVEDNYVVLIDSDINIPLSKHRQKDIQELFVKVVAER